MEKIENPICIGCGHELERVPEEDMMSFCGEEHEVHEYRCPHCGVYETAYCPDEEDKDNYPAYNDETEDIGDCDHGYYGFCPECGHHIIWSGDFMRSEVWGDVDGETDEWGCFKDDSLAPNVTCPYCGTSIEVVYPKPSEEKDYPAYNEKKNNNNN